MENVEYVFEPGIPNTVNLSDDNPDLKFKALINNILWNECLHIHYNIPENME